MSADRLYRMPVGDANHPVLDHASPTKTGEIPFLPAMQLWRSVAVWSLVAFVGGSLLFPPAGAAGLMVLLVASIITLVYMTRAAAREVSAGYALRHLVLAIALMPVFFLGVLIVPLMVQSDMIKWRDMSDRPRA